MRAVCLFLALAAVPVFTGMVTSSNAIHLKDQATFQSGTFALTVRDGWVASIQVEVGGAHEKEIFVEGEDGDKWTESKRWYYDHRNGRLKESIEVPGPRAYRVRVQHKTCAPPECGDQYKWLPTPGLARDVRPDTAVVSFEDAPGQTDYSDVYVSVSWAVAADPKDRGATLRN